MPLAPAQPGAARSGPIAWPYRLGAAPDRPPDVRAPVSQQEGPQMTSPESFDAGIASQIGHYADAVRVPAGYVEVRSKFIIHRPAFMLGVIPQLVRPDFLVEIEVIAAVPREG
jgi:hypothetical protein